MMGGDGVKETNAEGQIVVCLIEMAVVNILQEEEGT